MNILLRLSALLQLVRLTNLMMIVISQLIASYFIVFQHITFVDLLSHQTLILMIFSTVLVAAGGNVINDYFDVKIDIINKPEKLVVDNGIKRRTALLLHLILSTLGIILGFTVNIKIGTISTMAVFWLWIYSYQLKRRPLMGNVLVSLLTGISVYMPALLFSKPNRLLMVFALFAFLISLIREIIKDIEDMKGDGIYGCTTLPLLFGIRKTKKIVFIIVSVFCVVQIAVMIYTLIFALKTICLLSIISISFFSYKLYQADTQNEFHYLSSFCKWIMFGGVFGMCLI